MGGRVGGRLSEWVGEQQLKMVDERERVKVDEDDE